VVARAYRLLCDGALDGDGVEELAARVGMSGRQLRRLFGRHLGASPAEIARARRVHLAGNLIDQTTLPMTEVALSAGFASIRQFNYAVRSTFGSSPTALRRRRRAAPTESGLVLRLSYRPPLDWAALLAFLAERATPGVEAIEGDSYRRTIAVHGAAGWIEARPEPRAAQLLLRVQLPTYAALPSVVARARRLFDLDADPFEVAMRLRCDPLLRPWVDASPGLRVPGAWEPFELAVRAVLEQYAMIRDATALAARLVRAFGQPLAVRDGTLSHVFPSPAVLAAADLSKIGLPRGCSLTLRSLATAVAGGAIILDSPRGLDDAVASLVAIPGLAEATAHYVAIRALGEPDGFPSPGLKLRRGAEGRAQRRDTAALLARAERWRPWRAYAAMYLWNEQRVG
jgi:AraC family transcriptional regulator of adaptative response / DNA-3-methyladenine glycosylase II